MNCHLRSSLLFILIFLGITVSKAQQKDIKTSQFAVGIENTRLVYGQYTYKNHLIAKLNVSVYSEPLVYQYLRASIGYKTRFKNFGIHGEYFFGSAFNGKYYNTGARIKADATLIKRLLLEASFVPWYDSGYGYKTCFDAKIGCKITDHIDIKAGYTTIPEYRMSEKRILGGFDFHVEHLYVAPYLSLGTNSGSGGKNLRVIFNFGYTF